MKVKFWIGTNKVGSKVEEVIDIDDEEVEAMNKQEVENYIQTIYEEWVWQNVNGGWEIK